ncbi:MAG: tripartite tricarboxylate transporter substrate binding protein [Betaproteobacteria bacterium]|nr:tripartite tricarboxylate transporter substrate binding protein [Betaproteobacteria bacterium]
MSFTRRRFVSSTVASAALFAAGASPLRAAGYPERDITLVVPWAAGGGTDSLGRTLTKNAKQYIGVNVAVVNRPGGTGVAGMQSVATAKPDGYTIGLVTFHLSSYRLTGLSQLSYRDFEPIMLLNRSPTGFLVKVDSPYKSMKDLVDYAKANPGVVTVATSGAGAVPHLSAALLAKQLGIKLTFVPFDGGAPARTAVLGGHVTMLAVNSEEALQFYKSKQLRFLALNTDERHSSFPDVPTIAEAGFPLSTLLLDWRGLAAPKGTPPAVLDVLTVGFRKMADDPDYKRLMDEMALPRANAEREKYSEFLDGIEKALEPALAEVGLLKKI